MTIATKPPPLLQLIASAGGVQPDPVLRENGLTSRKRVIVPGVGWLNVVRKDGMTIDQARRLAHEAGYSWEFEQFMTASPPVG